jgi:hypothetical protein
MGNQAASKLRAHFGLRGITAAFAGTVQDEFASAASKWQSAALDRYEFTVEANPSVPTGCHGDLPARLTVRKGKVTRGFYLKTGEKTSPVRISNSCLRVFYTVDSLFASIAANGEKCPRLKVTYDTH